MEQIPLTPEQEAGAALAAIAWRYRDAETWRGPLVWQQFGERLRLAATTTSSLSRMWATLAGELGVAPPNRPEDRTQLAARLTGGGDQGILRAMRQETELIALVVRLANEERIEAWKAAKAAKESGDAGQEALL